MFCEPYRQALMDGAAGAEVPPRALAHLAVCTACTEAFASERTLFERIDGELAKSLDADVPASLVSRVRLAVRDERVSGRSWIGSMWTWGPVTAAAALAIFLLMPRIFPPVATSPPQPGATPPVSTQTIASAASAHPTPSADIPRHELPKRPLPVAATKTLVPAAPEVVVAPGEEAALLKYAAFLRRRADLAQSVASSENQKPLAIQPLEIGVLQAEAIQIEPLVKDSEGSSR